MNDLRNFIWLDVRVDRFGFSPAGDVAGTNYQRDPAAARDYLSNLVKQMGQGRGWNPIETNAIAARIAVIPPAVNVPEMVRILRPLGPPMGWPGAEKWYATADQLARGAQTQANSDQANTWTTVVPGTVAQTARDVNQMAREQLEVAKTQGIGSGVGVGLVFGGALLIYMGISRR